MSKEAERVPWRIKIVLLTCIMLGPVQLMLNETSQL